MLSVVQAVKGYDPAFGYEMALIIENGVKEMWGEDLISSEM
jgi:pyruvate dehydrogenase complex dehydrogenase (E1) component